MGINIQAQSTPYLTSTAWLFFFLFVLCIKTIILTALRDDFKHIRGGTE